VHIEGVDFSAGCIAGEEARVVRRIVAPCSEARKERANAFQTKKILGMRIADLHSSAQQAMKGQAWEAHLNINAFVLLALHGLV
jgi:hypothetical protein